ncbi:MAG: DsbA family protein [Candidatus Dasytiphilus stammeri]
MRIILIGLCILLTNQIVIADSFINGEHYITLNKPISGIPKVVEFFSFLCPHCYQLESMFHQKKNSSKFKIFKYHVGFTTENEKILTQAWSIAIALGIEQRTILPIFEIIIKNNLSYNNLCKVFTNLGISKRDYYYLWNSYYIRLLSFKQAQLANRIGINTVPTIVIDGKYVINNEVITIFSNKKNLQQYNKIITYLQHLD